MVVLVGLGNPTKRYQRSRHNVGQMVLDLLLASRLDGFELVKTDCFMNQSGVQVKQILKEKKAQVQELVVLHDDLDLDLGSFKLQRGRGSAGHKGVISIINALGTKDFWRLRIGIGRPPKDTQPQEFVLNNFSPLQRSVLGDMLPLLKERLQETFQQKELN